MREYRQLLGALRERDVPGAVRDYLGWYRPHLPKSRWRWVLLVATLAEAHFGDPHPHWLSDAAHSERRLIVLTSARAVDAYPTIQSFLIGCWAAVVPLALYAFHTGVGSRRPHA